MQVSVTFKNMKSSQYHKTYLQEKLDRLDKLLYNPGLAEVVLRAEKDRKIAEINLKADRLDLHASEEQESMSAAIDLASDKIKHQLIKSKKKLQEHRGRGRGAELESPLSDETALL